MVLLRWWFIFCASVAGVCLSAYLGFLGKLWEIDRTKLSFVIVAIYFGVSLFIGWLTRKAEKWPELVIEHLNVVDESGDVCMKIAIMGTTLGFSIMVSGAFSQGLVATPAAIADMAAGLSLIYLVTAVGVLCSMLLGLQAVNLRYLLPREA